MSAEDKIIQVMLDSNTPLRIHDLAQMTNLMVRQVSSRMRNILKKHPYVEIKRVTVGERLSYTTYSINFAKYEDHICSYIQ
ncbi:MAG: hypothetical protein DRO67_05240 [Candidatus Asgardarchaeum californiense]|nr:MAG: hypothetical protein DRO67_05240 [Candidatus Asgardarchaeum californiense]